MSQCPEISEVISVPETYVPVLKFAYLGISFELLYANLALKNIEEELSLVGNNILQGCDATTAMSLNGSRVTDKLLSMIPNYDAYHLTLKFIKVWGQKRGVYSNISGYFGGINWAICLTYTSLLYPTACAARLLFRFFHTLMIFPWPHPLYLCNIEESYRTRGLGQV